MASDKTNCEQNCVLTAITNNLKMKNITYGLTDHDNDEYRYQHLHLTISPKLTCSDMS